MQEVTDSSLNVRLVLIQMRILATALAYPAPLELFLPQWVLLHARPARQEHTLAKQVCQLVVIVPLDLPVMRGQYLSHLVSHRQGTTEAKVALLHALSLHILLPRGLLMKLHALLVHQALQVLKLRYRLLLASLSQATTQTVKLL